MCRRLRLLWVTPHLPRRGVAAARERWWALLARLALRHDVTLLAFVDPEDAGARDVLPPGLSAVHLIQKTGRAPADPLALQPRIVRWIGLADPSLRAAVAAQLADGRFDLVQYEYVEMGQVMPPPVQPTILTVHQLGFAAAAAEWRAQGGSPRQGAVALFRHLRDLDFELRAVARAHHVITMSAEDAERLRRFRPDLRISVSPVGVDCAHFQPPTRPVRPDVDMVFVGNFRHLANVDAAAFLAHEILPRLGRPACMRLVGRDVPRAVAALARPGAIEVIGDVPDVRPYLAGATVVVAPVRFGTGMRGKVLEALAMGRPVVTTSLGAEGLGASAGHHLLVADGARDFAAAVCRVLDDTTLAAHLGVEGRALATTRFDWDVIAAGHEAIYEAVLRDAVLRDAVLRDAGAIGRVPPFRAGSEDSRAASLGRWPALAAGAAVVAWRGLGWYLRRARLRRRATEPARPVPARAATS